MYAPETGQRGRRAQRGLSIVEIMVAIVISLLVALTARGGAVSFTASQRQGIGTGGAQLSAVNAVAALRDDASAAGLGFFGEALYLCPRLNLGVGATVVNDGVNFTPVQVTRETRGDRVDVIYATQVASGSNVFLAASSDGTTAQVRSLLPDQSRNWCATVLQTAFFLCRDRVSAFQPPASTAPWPPPR